MRSPLSMLAVAVATVSVAASFASAAALFAEPGESLTNYTQVADSRTTAAVVDYSTLGIPEAPGTLTGSTAATTGIMLTANKGAGTGAVTGINLVLGSTPQTFTGTHTLEFYVWMNLPSGATSTTEDFVGGVARSNTTNAIYGNFRTSRGNGAWMLLSGDNNLTTDYRHLNNGSGDVALGDENAGLAAKLNAAFTNGVNASPRPNDAANEWARVDIVLDNSGPTAQSQVWINGVLFSTDASSNTSGSAWFGYEDPASSVGSAGIGGVFDNIQVLDGVVTPEPATLTAVAGLGGLMLRRRRSR